MMTKYRKVDPHHPNIMVLNEGASIIRNGGVVAFPTETVYGLGADGLNGKAVNRIFKAKGRPADNPLILHIATMNDLLDVAEYVPTKAKRAIKAFWPGPLTIVLKKSARVPDEVSAGLETVAVRMPSHPVALKLIKLARTPIAAPSANLSGKPSPTKGIHVLRDLKGKIEMIIDGGSSLWGIESTVVDFSGKTPIILRPGAVTKEMLQAVVGEVAVDPGLERHNSAPRSPGVKYIHYAPNGAMYLLIIKDPYRASERIRQQILTHNQKGKRIALIASKEILAELKDLPIAYKGCYGSKKEPQRIASRIYHLLRNCDRLNIDVIFTEGIQEEGLGEAIMNRLRKASKNRIIET